MITICKKDIDKKCIKEKFTFIPDNMAFRDEEAYSASRRFLKELGLKGDCVGWFELENPTSEKVSEIFSKAKKEKFRIRGEYELALTDEYESEWYEITGCRIPETLDVMDCETYCADDKKYYLCSIKAFAMPRTAKIIGNTRCDFSCFREDVVKAITEEDFIGAEFLWIPDKGRYKAENQYYDVFPENLLPWCFENIYDASDYNIKSKDFEGLTEVSQIITKNCKALRFDLPLALERSLLPDSDFAGVYSRLTRNHRLLVKKHVRDFLIEKDYLKKDYFSPVLVVENISESEAKPLIKIESGKFSTIPQKIKDEIDNQYQKYLKKDKPERKATEKLALQALRIAKKENPELFGKRASEKILVKAIDERLIPYYKTANGGVISDEYRFYSVDESTKETADFWLHQNLENTDIIPEASVVVGQAMDGEYIILLPDGKVVRYEVGQYGFSYEWNNIESFFVEETE